MNSFDQQSFDELIAPFRAEVMGYCKRLAGTDWDGEDLFQETIIKAFRRFQRWPERELSKPYLYRIASNCWIDICRSEHLSIRPETLTEGSAISYSEWSRYDVRESLEWLMDTLEPRQVVLILLMDVFGFTPKETEAALNQPVTAIKSALHRARLRLKKAAEHHLYGLQDKSNETKSSNSSVNIKLFESFVEAFHQADVDSMFHTYRDLTQSGITVERIIRLRHQTYFYFKDPDGHSLMLTSRSKQT